MTSLDPRRTIVFAGDSVTDCGRRTDPEGLGYVRNLYDESTTEHVSGSSKARYDGSCASASVDQRRT
jgi:hypothetical protein